MPHTTWLRGVRVVWRRGGARECISAHRRLHPLHWAGAQDRLWPSCHYGAPACRAHHATTHLTLMCIVAGGARHQQAPLYAVAHSVVCSLHCMGVDAGTLQAAVVPLPTLQVVPRPTLDLTTAYITSISIILAGRSWER